MNSIQARLAMGVLLSVTLLLSAQWLLINKSIHHLSEQYLSSRLQHDADALVAAISINASGLDLDINRLGPMYHQPFSGHYYQVTYQANSPENGELKTIRSRSLWDETLTANTMVSTQLSIRRQAGPDQQQLLVLNRMYTKQAQAFAVAIAEDLTPVNRDIDRFLLLHTWVSLGILVALLLLQFILVRRSLRPLESIRRELTEMRSGELESISENVPVETSLLVRELNSSFDALRRKIQRSRLSAGNLAHALKRPLTLLRQMADDQESELLPHVRQQLEKYIFEVQNIIDSELKRARLAGRTIGGQRFNLEPEVRDLIHTLDLMYQAKSLHFQCHIPQQLLSPVEREDLHELLGNLLDNACKWAESTVRLTVWEKDSVVGFNVEDDGVELQDKNSAQLEEMTHRGKRLDESKPGHGLGLSIATDIAEAYGGSLHLVHSEELGGLLAGVRIPRH